MYNVYTYSIIYILYNMNISLPPKVASSHIDPHLSTCSSSRVDLQPPGWSAPAMLVDPIGSDVAVGQNQ